MRVGVIGPLAPDYFAENVGDALERGGHIVTHLGTTSPRHRSQDSHHFADARQAGTALPR